MHKLGHFRRVICSLDGRRSLVIFFNRQTRPRGVPNSIVIPIRSNSNDFENNSGAVTGSSSFSGRRGIRTPGTRKGTPVFKTGALNQTQPSVRAALKGKKLSNPTLLVKSACRISSTSLALAAWGISISRGKSPPRSASDEELHECLHSERPLKHMNSKLRLQHSLAILSTKNFSFQSELVSPRH